eukprot:CAMPEP_0178752632 /NCGR_PEP_ID=MMETSP0744-20121128/11165_1 /TAXON_ID=913974 /ORGANISM="Nitzschia punctata, Strain CCMP561" /LENGTH=280 /DNA_ID=CAMNT_0020406361 /DNA_START=1 /DNA_END=843 /DNA_ORIENTATION=-
MKFNLSFFLVSAALSAVVPFSKADPTCAEDVVCGSDNDCLDGNGQEGCLHKNFGDDVGNCICIPKSAMCKDDVPAGLEEAEVSFSEGGFQIGCNLFGPSGEYQEPTTKAPTPATPVTPRPTVLRTPPPVAAPTAPVPAPTPCGTQCEANGNTWVIGLTDGGASLGDGQSCNDVCDDAGLECKGEFTNSDFFRTNALDFDTFKCVVRKYPNDQGSIYCSPTFFTSEAIFTVLRRSANSATCFVPSTDPGLTPDTTCDKKTTAGGVGDDTVLRGPVCCCGSP